jgi:protease-4
VDRLGTLEDAVKAAAQLARVSEYRVEFVQPHFSWAAQLFEQSQARAAGAAASLFHADAQSLALMQVADRLDPMARDFSQLVRFSVPGHLYSYCFCQAVTSTAGR